MKPNALKPEERLIVALDVPTGKEALALVKELSGIVSFFKIGLELLIGGDMEGLLRALIQESRVFVDLKMPSDIPETVRRTVAVAADLGVRFLTLSHSATRETIQAAVAGRGQHEAPELLYVPVLSSLDRADYAAITGVGVDAFESELVKRAEGARGCGADGFIVSGQEIRLLRDRFPSVTLVSPGIRPAGSPKDDHKRSCTPSEAIRLGADYIVVGRPIRNATNRRDAARRIVDELASAESTASGASSFRDHQASAYLA
jgi:orotidine-5'-phosphate decarboxylase